jgi:hypothetical protein
VKFSEAEIRFLLQSHRLENATVSRSLATAVDLRSLGCPERIFNRVLEDRARRLGAKFTEFRSQPKAPETDLDSRVQAAKLF